MKSLVLFRVFFYGGGGVKRRPLPVFNIRAETCWTKSSFFFGSDFRMETCQTKTCTINVLAEDGLWCHINHDLWNY